MPETTNRFVIEQERAKIADMPFRNGDSVMYFNSEYKYDFSIGIVLEAISEASFDPYTGTRAMVVRVRFLTGRRKGQVQTVYARNVRLIGRIVR